MSGLFGDWLRRQRVASGIGQDELSRRVSCSPDMLRKLEAGRRQPSRQLAELLADFFGVPADEREAFIRFSRLPATAGDASAQQLLDANSAPWRTLRPTFTNVPASPTALLGRDRELNELREQLLKRRSRLLTITGPPGVGKTRLAISLAGLPEVGEEFADGVFFVPLAPLTEAGQVLDAIAKVLNVQESATERLAELLQRELVGKRLLLILDNFEHMLDAAASVAELLTGCPWLKVLTTSREELQLRGERVYQLEPLALPAAALLSELASRFAGPTTEQLTALRKLTEYAAFALYIERAADANPGFSLAGATPLAVAAICRQLEGLPLAIELIAPNRQLSPAQLLVQLQSGMPLAAGLRDLPPRQRSLHDAIGWSYKLLSSDEQAIFRRLAVFAGGFRTAAVAAVVGAGLMDSSGGASALLRALHEKSLLTIQQTANEPRFGMLETIREYARGCLIEQGEAERTAQAHADYFLALAQQAFDNKSGPDHGFWLAQQEEEHNNLRVALAWLVDYGRDSAAMTLQAVQLSFCLIDFWTSRGHFSEAREWLARVARNAEALGFAYGNRDQQMALGNAINGAGILALNQSDHDAAQRHFLAARELYRAADYQPFVLKLTVNLGLVEVQRVNPEPARRWLNEALVLARELGQRNFEAIALNNLGVTYWDAGDAATARPLYEQSLAINRALGNKSDMVIQLDNLGIVATAAGDFAAARRYLDEALAICREIDDSNSLMHVLANSGGQAFATQDLAAAASYYSEALALAQQLNFLQVIAKCLEGIARMCVSNARPLEAGRLWGAADMVRAAAHKPRSGSNSDYERELAAARASAGTAFAEAWAEGYSMSVEQAAQYGLSLLWLRQI